MQGLQCYPDASASQGLPNNPLHSHHSLQGELSLHIMLTDPFSHA